MDRPAVERFSIESRKKLIRSIDNVMVELGVSPKSEVESIESAGDVTIITLKGGFKTTITAEETKWRGELVEAIKVEGYDTILEKVAYTWFNRIIAVRYMEVNDYLPSHVRVLSSVIDGRKEPDIITQCLKMDLSMTQAENELVIRLKDSGEDDKLFSRLFIIQCRKLNEILPELFTKTKPYENLLLRISYIDPDGVVRDLVDNISEDDFRDAVQIIGWMYQFYNSELKDETFADLKKNVKISKEHIPAATQLFTPDWIVRYMVENSVGRVWLEGHDDPSLKSEWRYYLDEAEQEPDVQSELKRIRSGRADMMPSDIKVIDPCMGSGHILVYAFDVLMQIYESYGYMPSDAAEMIVTKNLYGLDIDDRAYQLAYFAVMMKARQYDPSVFSKGLKPNLYSIPESNGISDDVLNEYGQKMSPMERSLALNDLKYLIQLFYDAKIYGSLLKPKDVDYPQLRKALNDCTITLYSTPEIREKVREIVAVAELLSQGYESVITNPPYLGSSGMDAKLSTYVKDHYKDSKSDLFACFIERCIQFTEEHGYTAMITQHAFMFLSSFESLRLKICSKNSIVNMAHLGPHAFDQIGGEVVQSSSFILSPDSIDGYQGMYVRLIDGKGESEKESGFLSGENRFYVKQDRFNAIPGSPIAYWLSDNMIECFKKGTPLNEIASPRQGLATGENARFVRLWHEVSLEKIKFDCRSREESVVCGCKWFPYNKGGEYRKWYGNNDSIVNWYNDGEEIRDFKDEKGKLRSRPQNMDYYFHPSITWSKISSGSIAFRYKPSGHIFDVAGTSIFASENLRRYIHGFCNSKVALAIANAISPTLNYEVGHIASFPIIINEDIIDEVDGLVQANIEMAKEDWDDQEISWDFSDNPLIRFSCNSTIEGSFTNYHHHCIDKFNFTKRNEEQINSLFIGSYGLDDELGSEVSEDRITIRIPDVKTCVIDLISYAVGCMFGRYSLDSPGLQYAGGDFKSVEQRFMPDLDNVIPINDNEYFSDDIVSRFIEFIRIAFGDEHLEENLKFIANNLGVKGAGTSRDIIRKYFLNDFYKDHLKMYSNLPIYWLFDSGKENGFKALIYMHRYDENLIAKMRQDYLLPMYRRYNEMFESEKDPVERSRLEKKINELSIYDLAMELYSTEKVSIDLDDGVKVNYAKFQNIDNPGGKGKINLLYKLK